MSAQSVTQTRILLEEEDYLFFQQLIFDLCGIALSPKKSDLVANRLHTYVVKLGLNSFSEYRSLLAAAPPGGAELQTFINLLTTNKTEFFREPSHFDHFIDVLLPSLVRAAGSRRKISVWCAASSTGEEPATIAMVLQRHLPEGFSFEVLATDIDTEVLIRAKNGVYPRSRLDEVPETYRRSSVQLGQGRASGWFKVNDLIHKFIVFRQHNLVDATDPSPQPFDVIFCRNVLIYFSPPTIQALTQKLHRMLKRNGTLYIGHAESLPGRKDLFEVVVPSILRKT